MSTYENKPLFINSNFQSTPHLYSDEYTDPNAEDRRAILNRYNDPGDDRQYNSVSLDRISSIVRPETVTRRDPNKELKRTVSLPITQTIQLLHQNNQDDESVTNGYKQSLSVMLDDVHAPNVAFQNDKSGYNSIHISGVAPTKIIVAPTKIIKKRLDIPKADLPKYDASIERHGRFVLKHGRIGSGASKTVLPAYDIMTGRDVAWNIVKRSSAYQDETMWEMAKFECVMLQLLDHPNIIQLYDAWEISKTEFHFIVERIQSGSLTKHIEEIHPFLTLPVIQSWCKQILSALNYMHQSNPRIVHFDLKCDNCLIDTYTGTVKLCDFGSVRIYPDENSMQAGSEYNSYYTTDSLPATTPEYTAPEILGKSFNGMKNKCLVDIYSLGMSLLYMLTKMNPYEEFGNSSLPQVAYKICTEAAKGTLPMCYHQIVGMPPEVKDFINQCICPYRSRATASKLLQHPFLTTRYNGTAKVCEILHVITLKKIVCQYILTSGSGEMLQFQLQFTSSCPSTLDMDHAKFIDVPKRYRDEEDLNAIISDIVQSLVASILKSTNDKNPRSSLNVNEVYQPSQKKLKTLIYTALLQHIVFNRMV